MEKKTSLSQLIVEWEEEVKDFNYIDRAQSLLKFINSYTTHVSQVQSEVVYT